MKTIRNILFLIILSSKAFGQIGTNPNLDSILYGMIPFDSAQAILDLDKGKIQIISLMSSTMLVDPSLTSEDLSIIEERFGFKYYNEEFDIPQEYLTVRRKEYNNVVYDYLDSINNCHSHFEIEAEVMRIVLDKYLYFVRSDKAIATAIRKEVRGEKSDIRNRIISAEIDYRDKNFIQSLEKYQDIMDNHIKKRTRIYINNSVYRCLLNLKRYNEAMALKSNPKNQIRIFQGE